MKTLKGYWKDEPITLASIESEISKHSILQSTSPGFSNPTQIPYRFASNICFRDNGFPIFEITFAFWFSEISEKETIFEKEAEIRFIRLINFRGNCLDGWIPLMYFTNPGGWKKTTDMSPLKNGEMFQFSDLSETLQKAMNDIVENWILPFLLQIWVKNTEDRYQTMFDMNVLKEHNLSFKDILTFKHLEME